MIWSTSRAPFTSPQHDSILYHVFGDRTLPLPLLTQRPPLPRSSAACTRRISGAARPPPPRRRPRGICSTCSSTSVRSSPRPASASGAAGRGSCDSAASPIMQTSRSAAPECGCCSRARRMGTLEKTSGGRQQFAVGGSIDPGLDSRGHCSVGVQTAKAGVQTAIAGKAAIFAVQTAISWAATLYRSPGGLGPTLRLRERCLLGKLLPGWGGFWGFLTPSGVRGQRRDVSGFFSSSPGQSPGQRRRGRMSWLGSQRSSSFPFCVRSLCDIFQIILRISMQECHLCS